MLILLVFIPFLHMVILSTMLSLNQIRLIYTEIPYRLNLAYRDNIILVAFYRNIFILYDKRMFYVRQMIQIYTYFFGQLEVLSEE